MENQKDKSKKTLSDDYDSPWKKILSEYFEQFMLFFFPKIHEQIDWNQGYESLDKELHQVIREAKIGGRLADKLFKVWTKNGEEAWVLIHIEVQAQRKNDFAHRTFVYNYRFSEIFFREIFKFEEENKMRFVNVAERSGMKKMLVRLLKNRFGKIPSCLEDSLRFPYIEVLEELGDSIFDFQDISDVEKWWENHGRHIPVSETAHMAYDLYHDGDTQDNGRF